MIKPLFNKHAWPAMRNIGFLAFLNVYRPLERYFAIEERTNSPGFTQMTGIVS